MLLPPAIKPRVVDPAAVDPDPIPKKKTRISNPGQENPEPNIFVKCKWVFNLNV